MELAYEVAETSDPRVLAIDQILGEEEQVLSYTAS